MRFDAYRNVYAFPARCIPFMILDDSVEYNKRGWQCAHPHCFGLVKPALSVLSYLICHPFDQVFQVVVCVLQGR